MTAKTLNLAAFVLLSGALLLGTALPGPSADDEARATAAVLAEAQRAAQMDHAAELAARRICQDSHGAGAVHRWAAGGELVCHRSAVVAQGADTQAIRLAMTGKQPKE